MCLSEVEKNCAASLMVIHGPSLSLPRSLMALAKVCSSGWLCRCIAISVGVAIMFSSYRWFFSFDFLFLYVSYYGNTFLSFDYTLLTITLSCGMVCNPPLQRGTYHNGLLSKVYILKAGTLH